MTVSVKLEIPLFCKPPCSTIALYRTKVLLDYNHFLRLLIVYSGGIVLWSRSFTPEAAASASSSTSPVNSLIREALIEGRSADEKYEKDGYAVKWTFVNDLELIFVVRVIRISSVTLLTPRAGRISAHTPADIC